MMRRLSWRSVVVGCEFKWRKTLPRLGLDILTPAAANFLTHDEARSSPR